MENSAVTPQIQQTQKNSQPPPPPVPASRSHSKYIILLTVGALVLLSVTLVATLPMAKSKISQPTKVSTISPSVHPKESLTPVPSSVPTDLPTPLPTEQLSLLLTVDKQITSSPSADTANLPVCPEYGPNKTNDFYTKYTVKKDDTLESIASTMLGDSSRTTDIIRLNSNKYPQLTYYNPSPEAGWVLLLPPSYVKNYSGNLEELSGNLINKGHDFWSVQTGRYENNIVNAIYITKQTYTDAKQPFQIGDCISAVIDPADQTAFGFFKQKAD